MYAGTTSLVQCCHCGHMFKIQELSNHMKKEEQQLSRKEKAQKLLEKRKAEKKKAEN